MAMLSTARPFHFHLPSISALLAPFASFGAALTAAHEVETLLDMSDAELAAQGVSRDTAVRHAFRDYLDG